MIIIANFIYYIKCEKYFLSKNFNQNIFIGAEILIKFVKMTRTKNK